MYVSGLGSHLPCQLVDPIRITTYLIPHNSLAQADNSYTNAAYVFSKTLYARSLIQAE